MNLKSRKEFDNQYDWLLYLQNDLGYNELRICHNYIDNYDELRFSKWKNFLELQHEINNSDFINKATHRSILDIELVLDIDEVPTQFISIKHYAYWLHKRLEEIGQEHFVYFTGNKSYHIHIFDYRLRDLKNRDIIKRFIYDILKTDGLKLGHSMIALEGAKHYRSGKIKEVVKEWVL